jgi:hypothetical protein
MKLNKESNIFKLENLQIPKLNKGKRKNKQYSSQPKKSQKLENISQK